MKIPQTIVISAHGSLIVPDQIDIAFLKKPRERSGTSQQLKKIFDR